MTRLLRPRRRISPLWLLGACLLAPATDAWPQTETEHAPPPKSLVGGHAPRHGGQFGDADDLYHYEVLLESSRRLILYVNDERNEPLDVRSLDGRWVLRPDDATPVAGRLTPSDDGVYFVAELPVDAREDPVHVKVEVLKGEQWAAMEFFLPRATE